MNKLVEISTVVLMTAAMNLFRTRILILIFRVVSSHDGNRTFQSKQINFAWHVIQFNESERIWVQKRIQNVSLISEMIEFSTVGEKSSAEFTEIIGVGI